MKTGEGKTLAAVAPLYLNALTGKGSHLVTAVLRCANAERSGRTALKVRNSTAQGERTRATLGASLTTRHWYSASPKPALLYLKMPKPVRFDESSCFSNSGLPSACRMSGETRSKSSGAKVALLR